MEALETREEVKCFFPFQKGPPVQEVHHEQEALPVYDTLILQKTVSRKEALPEQENFSIKDAFSEQERPFRRKAVKGALSRQKAHYRQEALSEYETLTILEALSGQNVICERKVFCTVCIDKTPWIGVPLYSTVQAQRDRRLSTKV